MPIPFNCPYISSYFAQNLYLSLHDNLDKEFLNWTTHYSSDLHQFMVHEMGLEPTRPKAKDFKSFMTANSITRAQTFYNKVITPPCAKLVEVTLSGLQARIRANSL